MNHRRLLLLERINRILESVTPLPGDCGALCGAKCCKGGDHDGMWLLPDEYLLLQDASFLSIRETKDGKYAICSDQCDRHLRPIACRMFPYFPLIYRKRGGGYSIRAVPDTRALAQCALFSENAPKMDPAFQRAVRRAGLLMLRDRELRKWLQETGEYIQDIAKVRQLLEKE